MKTELESFFEQYQSFDEMEPPSVVKTSESITLQFNGWAVILLPNGRYYLEDTGGG